MTSHDNTSNGTSLPSGTYLAIIGLLTSIGALSTDIMLPALAVLGGELGVGNINHTKLVVTVFSLVWPLASLLWALCRMPMAANRLFSGVIACSSRAVFCHLSHKAGP